MPYTFDTQIVFAADNPGVVMTSASVTLYSPTDLSLTSVLAITDTFGQPVGNPVIVSAQGFIPAFRADIPQVRWVSGGYSGYLNSYTGMRDEAVAAKVAAQQAATAASSAVPIGGTEGQVLTKVNGLPTWQTLPIQSGGTGTGRTDHAVQSTTTSLYPARPTPDPGIVVFWIGWTEPARITSGTAGAHPNDLWIRRAAP